MVRFQAGPWPLPCPSQAAQRIASPATRTDERRVSETSIGQARRAAQRRLRGEKGSLGDA